jgi:uncharacterized membrane protein YdfJ with MMPL/SSD domain
MNFTEKLARASSRRPWLIIGIWIAALGVGLVCVVTLLGGALSSGRTLSGSDFKRGQELIEEAFPEQDEASELIIVRSDTQTIDDPPFKQLVEDLTQEVDATGVATATNVYEDPEAALVADDRRAVAIPVRVLGKDDSEKEENVIEVVDVVEASDGRDGLDTAITGAFASEADFGTLAEEDLQKGELFFGLPAALVILLLVFGAVVGALVPLIVAGLSIVVALGLVALTGQIGPHSLFIVNMLTGMGLALGIDYSLFVITRYREERWRGREKLEAIATAGATSSRAVLFSGLVFVLALSGMLLVPDSVTRSLAAGAILVGIASVIAALTFLPALLGLLGDRVNRLRVPIVGRNLEASAAGEGRFWSAVAHRVMARPVVSLVAATALLLVLAAPLVDLKIGDTGVAVVPDRLPSKQGFLVLNEEFPGATTEPAEIVIADDVRSDPVEEAMGRLESSLEADGIYGPATLRVSETGDVGVLSVPLAGDPEGELAKEAVRDLRDRYIPAAFSGVDAEVVVTGATAEAVDAGEIASRWMPIVIALVLGLSFVLLTITFRSLVVPLKAIVLNLLSVGAAYGLIVLVFQKGYGADLLGFQQVETVESWVPLFLFSVLFGLSMDYHVFLLTRIRERFGRTGDNTEAVAYGVGSTARLITGAALIMVAVFTGFAIGDLVMFQQMGFGLAVALILDATIVRSVLVPASMKLLGERNWYLPSWLQWLPHLDVEGPPGEARPAAPTSAH